MEQTLPEKADYWPTVWLMLSYISYIAQAHLSRDGFGPSGLGPFTSISNPEMSHRYATGQSDERNFFYTKVCQVDKHNQPSQSH